MNKQKIAVFTIIISTLFILSACEAPQTPSPAMSQKPPVESTVVILNTPTEKPTSPPVPTETPIPLTATEIPITVTPTPGIGSTQVSEKDGMVLLYVPAGEFQMGYDKSSDNVKPAHTVRLDAFWIDQTEITNAMYGKCVSDGICLEPEESTSHNRLNYFTDDRYTDFPVISVPWNEASAYCQWAGRELPTEAQWEKAARGTDSRPYPWGDKTPDKELLNFNSPLDDTKMVGIFPAGASPYGALDMAGNVWEWTADWYAKDYYQSSPAENPTGPASGYERVIRGGGWGDDMSVIRTFVRRGLTPVYPSNDLGFRCALSK